MRSSIIISTILCLLLSIGVSKAQKAEYDMIMYTTGMHDLHDGKIMQFYGFKFPGPQGLQFPGPILEGTVGDSMIIHMHNMSQGAPHTVHWHGLDVNQYNDGVPAFSWVLGHHGDSIYSFPLTHAGTYLYHCHVASVIHVQMGMYGTVVVHPTDGPNYPFNGGPRFDRDQLWLMSDIDYSWHKNIPVHNTDDSVHARFPIPDFDPDYFLINGRSQDQLSDLGTALEIGTLEKIYLRLANIGFLENRIIFPAGVQKSVISSDGRAIPNPLSPDTIRVQPGERFGVMLEVNSAFSDSVVVQYVDMNTGQLEGEEKVPIRAVVGLGLNNASEFESVQLYPNPVSDQLMLKGIEDNDSFHYQVHDLLGRTIEQGEIGSERTIDLIDLSSGHYNLLLQNGSTNRSFPFIKQ